MNPIKHYHKHEIVQNNEPQNLDEKPECSICREVLDNSAEVVAHEGQGHLHPVHKKCVEPWVVKHFSCPECRVPVYMEAPPIQQENP